jgi:hypothetical protein
MKNCVALLAVALCCSAASRQATIPSGSAIYVDSSNGFDKFLTAAFQSQHLALRVVSSPEEADYTFDSTVMPTWDVVRKGGKRRSAAAVKLTSKSGEVIWRHTVTPAILKRGGQSMADDCARNMKSIVAKAPKP